MITRKKLAFGSMLSAVLMLSVAHVAGIKTQTPRCRPEIRVGGSSGCEQRACRWRNSRVLLAPRPATPRNRQGSVPTNPSYPPPPQGGYDQGGYNAPEYAQGGYGDNADEQPIYAPEPPPEMPQYEQPYCPGDDYIWTSGYWYWTQSLEVLK